MAETKTKAPAKRATPKTSTLAKVEPNKTEQLLKLAIDKDLDVAKLEKLIDLANQQEERAAKRDFDEHFAAMQKQLIPVSKDRAVTNEAGKELYQYATLDQVIATVGPILTDHGFSYRWEEESILEGKEKRVTCIISGWGFEKRTTIDIPIQPSTKFTNQVQQRGSATKYGMRYSFKAAVGIVDEAEDNDARGSEEREEIYREYISAIRECETQEKLKRVYNGIFKALEGDEHGRSIMREVKNQQKEKIAAAQASDPDPETPKPKPAAKATGKKDLTDKLEKMKAEATDAEKVEEKDGELPIY